MIHEVYDEIGDALAEHEKVPPLLPPSTRAIVKSTEKRGAPCRCGSCVVCEFRGARELRARREGRIR